MGFFLGIAIGIIVFLLVNWRRAKKKKAIKLQMYSTIVGPIDIPVATISKDIGPLFSRYVSNSSTIDIVGDGYYAHSPNQHLWMKCLKTWLKMGVSINYLLIEADQLAVDSLQPLALNYPDRFNIYIVGTDSDDEKTGKIAQLFMTMHPVIIKTVDGNGMWLEKHHPRHSCHAYNNRFVPPGQLEGGDLALFNKFDGYLKYVKNTVKKATFSEAEKPNVLDKAA